MDLRNFVKPALVASAVLALAAAPASADQRDRGRSQERKSAESARPAERGAPMGRAVPRAEAPRAAQPAPRTDNRSYQQAPRSDNRGYQAPRYDNRSYQAPRYDNRSYQAPRYEGQARPRVYAPAPRYDSRSYGRSYYVPRYYSSPRIWVARPYRPGLSFSFGLFFGTPYRYRWAYPVYVPVPYGYPGYSIPAGVPYGGISFGSFSPYDAAVFVDGQYVGSTSSFDGVNQPLTLTAGRHRIELQAQGYAPIAFDVDILPGQVIPYQGGMQPGGYGY
jgi:hypothetical protein